MMQQQLVMMMERQHVNASISTSQFHHYYVEDHDHQPLPFLEVDPKE